MKPTLTLLTALILTLSTVHAQQVAPNTVRDHLWLFAVPADGPRFTTRAPATGAAPA